MRKKMRGDNKGFSLVELIVAVLILGIISAAAVAGFSAIHNAKVGAAAQTIMNAMKQVRTRAMGKKQANTSGEASVYAEIKKVDSSYYIDIIDTDGATKTVVSSDKIGSDALSIKVSFHTDATGSVYEFGDESDKVQNVKFFFEKGTGAVYLTRLDIGGVETVFGAGGIPVIDSITIEGASETRDLIVVPVTGRCYMAD